MNLDENIRNAVVVLRKTYESVNKMLQQCRAVSEDYGYLLISDKILRWKSDANTDGWLVNSFILVFQKISDEDCASGNGWKDGPIYAVEVFLGSAEEPDVAAQLHVSKFEYDDINTWTPDNLAPGDHWAFFGPTHQSHCEFHFTDSEGLFTSEPISEKHSRQYWGLVKTTWKNFPLSSVTGENMEQLVFGTFDELE